MICAEHSVCCIDNGIMTWQYKLIIWTIFPLTGEYSCRYLIIYRFIVLQTYISRDTETGNGLGSWEWHCISHLLHLGRSRCLVVLLEGLRIKKAVLVFFFKETIRLYNEYACGMLGYQFFCSFSRMSPMSSHCHDHMMKLQVLQINKRDQTVSTPEISVRYSRCY